MNYPIILARNLTKNPQKRPPTVRDAFSEAFGVKNRRCWYGRDIRYRKRPSGVPNASSKVRQTASCSTECIFESAKTASCYIERIFKGPQNSRLHRLWTASCCTGRIFRGVPCQKQHLPTGRRFSARNAHRSEVSKYKKRMTSKSIKTF